MTESSSPAAEGHGAPARGVGEADDGNVRAVVERSRLLSLELDPRVLRSADARRLGGTVVEAINRAFGDLLARQVEDGSDLVIEPLVLARQMRGLREDLGDRMDHVTASIRESVTGLRKEAEVTSAVPSMDFGEMFDQLIDVLETIGGVPGDDAEPVAGEGDAGEGRVRVVCEPGPRLSAMTIQPRAMRGSHELSGHAVTAVNAALEDLAAKLLERRKNAGADPEEIRARLDGLRELGVERMRSYGQAMSAMMGSIRPRD